MRRRLTALLSAVLLAATAPLLAACSTSAGRDAGTSTPGIVLENGWAKAGESGGMTGVFGTVVNQNGHEIVFDGAESDSAASIELHEVTPDGVMRQIEGETRIAAGASFELAPGANHLMLMGLREQLLAGETVTLTLRFTSPHGSDFSQRVEVLVKDYAGANEEYGDLAHDAHAEH